MNKLGLFCIVLGVIGLISFLITILLAGYIDERIKDDCDSDIGTIGQITGLDEGECQNARDLTDSVSSLQVPSLLTGVSFIMIGGVLIRKKN
ncbi:MAG: hypothetical protein CL974_00505 [Euryarchaeota archaeon]|nr:hypothetical protein [Euryarchaeota archaeon]